MKLSTNFDAEIVGLTTRLREKIADYSQDRGAGSCQLHLVRARSAAYSRLFVFHGSNQEGALKVRLAVKVYNGLDQLSFARQQFDALNLLWGDFSKLQRLRIPRPLDFWPELPAIVMEEVRGCSVVHVLYIDRLQLR